MNIKNEVVKKEIHKILQKEIANKVYFYGVEKEKQLQDYLDETENKLFLMCKDFFTKGEVLDKIEEMKEYIKSCNKEATPINGQILLHIFEELLK